MAVSREREKRQAILLRKHGKSYNEIRRIFQIKSKGTISYWLKGIPLSASARRKLAEKMRLANDRGLFRFNSDRTARIKNENQAAFEIGKDAVRKLSSRELLLVGAALYWGEGVKSFSRSDQYVSFVNSDE